MKDYLSDPLDWSLPEIEQLRDLFVLVYEDRGIAREFAYKAGLLRGTFTEATNMRIGWGELMNTMALQGILRNAIAKAAEDRWGFAHRDEFLAFLSLRPGLPPPPVRQSQSYLMPIGLAEQIVAAAQSVARLIIRFDDGVAAYATGFLTSPNHLLTVHHAVTFEPVREVDSITASFDYTAELGSMTPLGVKKEPVAWDAAYDWAVFELEQPSARPPLALGSPRAIGRNDTIIVIQHPLGQPKQFEIHPDSVQYSDEVVVHYIADTQPGSGGAPVFDCEMHVIAMHHAHAPVETAISGRKETIWRKEGIGARLLMRGLQRAGIPFISGES